MSRRYGRNQKRAHRERIASLEAQLAGAHTDIFELKQQADFDARVKRQQLDTITRCITVLGERHPALPPSLSFFRPNEDYGLNMGVQRNLIDGNPEIEIERLLFLTTQAHMDDLHRQMHVRVTWGGERWAYAMNKRTFESMPLDHAVTIIADELGYLIAQSIKKMK